MTDCNGCGDCCDPVGLAVSPEMVRARPQGFSERFRQWVTAELVPISLREAYARLPALAGAELGRPGYATRRHWYRCPHLDAATRRCTAYERRPLTCAGFPWYRGAPSMRTLAAFPRCSFHADVAALGINHIRGID